MIEYKMSENPSIAKRYGVRVVPTVVIDAEVKIEGEPDIPFVCDAETYDHFRNKYPLRP
jgi:predicted DsbA family dithiol-disulfide isomerase